MSCKLDVGLDFFFLTLIHIVIENFEFDSQVRSYVKKTSRLNFSILIMLLSQGFSSRCNLCEIKLVVSGIDFTNWIFFFFFFLGGGNWANTKPAHEAHFPMEQREAKQA